MPTVESLTKLNAQRWLPSSAELKTMQKATGYLAEYVAWLLISLIRSPTQIRLVHYPKTLMRPKKYEALTLRCEIACVASGAAALNATILRRNLLANGSVHRYCSLYGYEAVRGGGNFRPL